MAIFPLQNHYYSPCVLAILLFQWPFLPQQSSFISPSQSPQQTQILTSTTPSLFTPEVTGLRPRPPTVKGICV